MSFLIIDTKAKFKNTHSYLFDGVNESITIPDTDVLSFVSGGQDQAFTINVWAKMGDATNFIIFCKGSQTTREYRFGTRGTDKLAIELSHPDGNTAIGQDSTSAITSDENTWHMYSATYNGNETAAGMKLYRDGVALAQTATGVGSYTGMTNSTSGAIIGRFFTNGTAYSNGYIDELSTWNVELTSEQIAGIYNNGNPNNILMHNLSANIVSYYRCDFDVFDGTNFTVKDSKGTNNGTTSNMEAGDKTIIIP